MLKRALVTLALVLGLIAGSTTPAAADHSRDTQRTRAGVSGWVPRAVDFDADYNTTAWGEPVSVFVFGFDWHQSEHTADLEGDFQALELEVVVPCSWVDNGFPDVNGDYVAAAWDTNVPGSAYPYEETLFQQPCDNGRIKIGAGVLRADRLVHGQHYYIRIGIRPGSAPPTHGSVRLIAQTGTIYNTEVPGNPYDNGDCLFSSSEESYFNGVNDRTTDAFNLRQEAAWCPQIDFTHLVVPKNSGLDTNDGVTAFMTNRLYNQGMEQAGIPGYFFASGNNYLQYCNTAPYAYDGACYVQMNKGTNGTAAAIAQDVTNPLGGPWPVGRYTSEAALRCRSGSSCDVEMFWNGLGTEVTPSEIRSARSTIPNDGLWYICRADKDHGVASFGFPHDTIRWKAYERSGNQIDVDFTFFGRDTFWNDADNSQKDIDWAPTPGVGEAGVGDICTPGPKYVMWD